MIRCTDCGRKRDAFRPVVRLADGTILFTCRACWRALDYASFMLTTKTFDDLAALAKRRR